MEIITSAGHMKDRSRAQRGKGKTIGFVPTMGYLHEGHLSLMRRGRSENDLLVASIFVNPTQFGPGEDLASYPRDPENDTAKCRDAGVDVLFMPDADDIYPAGFQTYVDVREVSRPLCGASRPGHFRGVATVVAKLFNMVRPTKAYFGAKDYQQLRVITTMVRDLAMDVRVVPCPTLREADGLAMSSRNSYLSAPQRRQATCLYEALLAAGECFERGESSAQAYLDTMTTRVNQEPDAAVDYIALVDPESLLDLEIVNDCALAVMAVKIGATRLIDNMVFKRPVPCIQGT